MSEPQPIVYANGLVEPVTEDGCSHLLQVGGYPALLADHCELVDRVAKLEERLASLEMHLARLYGHVVRHIIDEMPEQQP